MAVVFLLALPAVTRAAGVPFLDSAGGAHGSVKVVLGRGIVQMKITALAPLPAAVETFTAYEYKAYLLSSADPAVEIYLADVYPDAIVMRPSEPDVMVMASAEHNPATWRTSHYAGGMVWRSTDAGVTWERLRTGLPEQTKHEFGALSLDDWGESFSLYAATTGGELYASDDGGDQWSLLASDLGAVSKRGHDELVVAAAS